MNSKIMKGFLVSLLSFGLIGCNEKLHIETVEQGMPVLISFSPESGKAGSEITIQGEQLRDVLSATIGGVETAVKYKISQTRLVLEVPANAKSGIIALTSPLGSTQSEAAFTMNFPVPSVTKFAESGKVGSQLELLGSDLSGISALFFNDIRGEVVYQRESELIVTVPFVLDDDVALSFNYLNAEGEQTVTLPGMFNIVKPQPFIASSFPANVKEGQNIELEGDNLHLIEKILFGTTEANISRKEDGMIAFRVPTLPQSCVVPVIASYYEGTKTLDLHDACDVFIPQVFHYAGVELGTHRNEIGNLLNAATGDVLSPCFLATAAADKNDAALQLIDFTGYINGSYSFTFYGPQGTTGTLKNYWCGGKIFTKAATLDALTAEGYGAFLGIQTTFMVLSEEDPIQNEVIEQVRNESVLKISPETLPNLFNGMVIPLSNSVRSRAKTEAADTQTTLIFKEGSVVLFKNAVKGKIGLVWVRKLNIDYDQTTAVANSTSSAVIDILYER